MSNIDTTLHSLLERKMTMATEHEEAPPPPVPRKADPDAPPVYKPSDGPPVTLANTDSHTTTTSTSSSQSPSGVWSAYTNPVPLSQQQRAASYARPSPDEISIPFYSNPPPAPDHPARVAERKEPILSDAPRPSKEIDRLPSFACLTLHSNDKLGSANLSAEITNDLDGVIRSKWAKGVQKWAFEDGGWCWQLQGKPCK